MTSQDRSRLVAALARDQVNVDLKTVDLRALTRATVGAIIVCAAAAVQAVPRLPALVAGARL